MQYMIPEHNVGRILISENEQENKLEDVVLHTSQCNKTARQIRLEKQTGKKVSLIIWDINTFTAPYHRNHITSSL